MDIPEIKSRLSILTVLSHYGLKPDKHDMLLCPFHEEKTPSFTIYPKTNTFHCFGCGMSGDCIELIQLKENLSKHEAIKKAESLIKPLPIVKEPVIKPRPEEMLTPEERTRILTKIFEGFKNGLHHPASVKSKEYLQSRRLDYTLLEMGYNTGQFHYQGRLNETDQKACIKAGLLIPYNGSVPNGNGITYTAFAKDCIIFPLKGKQDQIISLYGRSITNNDKPLSAEGSPKAGKHFYLKDRTGLYPGYPTPNTQKLILTEAIIDAATLLQLPEITAQYSILACYGTNGLTEEHKAVIMELQSLEEIIFFFDGDNAGNEGIKHHAETFLQLLPSVKISYVETPENEDINSLMQGHESEIFTHLLESRKEFYFLTENSSIKKENLPEPVRTTGILNIRNPEFITYTTEELQIILLGGINLHQLDRLRVTIKISRTDTKNPLHSIRHTLDLYHSDYLEKFIEKVSEKLETTTIILNRALAQLIDEIEKYRLTKIESQKEQKPKRKELTEQQRQKAIGYLKVQNLLHRTNEDIGKTGVIGEENNRLLMYLVFTSRLREQPLHIISLGASGTGKTYLQEKISELVPEHDKLEITILSENAFYYFDQRELKNKLVLIEDMDGAENVLYPLRELQSKKRISKTIPIKDSKGNLKTITLKVEGPICLAGTTTRERLYEDNANRSLLIYIDNSQQHRELIMDYQRKLSAGKIEIRREQQLKEFFQHMQMALNPVKVRNPFAEYLKIPEYVFKPLRTNSHYLAFIETITFYHQYQREVKTCQISGERYIETTLEDIEWANRLLNDILLAKSDELPNATRTFFESVKGWLKSNGKESFYTKDIRETFRITSSSCNRYILELLRNSYIKVAGGNKYRQGYEYQVVKYDEYEKLQQNVKTALDEALERIKKQYPGIPPVSQKRNGILNEKIIKGVELVSQ